ncbi:hypothetical protein LAZ67_15002566 [Cordylochernes scorpioides]|uniref:Uncharacterized protein n=1 Tax=Cordylochernes scorpioides TaxID=51811 RepID=A0ABY6LD79_9ARAC|nr:hypothetical protein LAZ67_15002566 [Cordylochernes scorpioides]
MQNAHWSLNWPGVVTSPRIYSAVKELLCRLIVFGDIVFFERSLGFDTAVESWSQYLGKCKSRPLWPQGLLGKPVLSSLNYPASPPKYNIEISERQIQDSTAIYLKWSHNKSKYLSFHFAASEGIDQKEKTGEVVPLILIMKGKRFDTKEEIKRKLLDVLRSLMEDATCFAGWEKRWRRCRRIIL